MVRVHRRAYGTEVDCKDTGCDVVDYIQTAQGRTCWPSCSILLPQ
jgi:hypothetical protein